MATLLYRLFIFLLIFSPLAFGTVELWSLAVMETLAILALVLLFFRNKKEVFYQVPGIVPLVLFLVYVLIQLVPLPAGFIRFISPNTYSLYHETVGIVEPVGWMSISVNKRATLGEFFRFAAYAGLYVVTIQLLTKKELLKDTVRTAVVFASVLAIIALLQDVLSNDKIFWFRKVSVAGIPFAPFGPFVNRNHFAGFMLMMFPIALSLFVHYKPLVHYGTVRDRIAEIFIQQRTSIYVLLGFSGLLMATAIFVARSRGAIISLILTSIFLMAMLLVKGRVKRQGGLLFILTLVLLVFSVGWFGWEPIFEKFGNMRNAHGDIAESRLPIWRDCADIIRDFPSTGAGFGTFLHTYPGYHRSYPGKEILGHAHNDYMELVTDGGVIGFLLAAWFLIAVLFKSFRVFGERKEPFSICLYLGSITGIIAFLMHSFTEFNFHIGANGLYFFFLAGLAVSAANTRLRHESKDTNLKEIRSPLWKIFGVPAGVLLIGSLVFNVGGLMGEVYCSPFQANAPKEDISRERLLKMSNAAYKAARFDPLEAAYPFEAARAETLLTNSSAALANCLLYTSPSPRDRS